MLVARTHSHCPLLLVVLSTTSKYHLWTVTLVGDKHTAALWPSLNREPKLAAAVSVFPPALCCAKNAHPRPSSEGSIGKSEQNIPALLFPVVLTASDTCQLHLVAQAMRAATLPCALRRICVSCCSPCPGCSIRSQPRLYFSLRVPVQPQGLFYLTAAAKLSGCSVWGCQGCAAFCRVWGRILGMGYGK